jgi:hypothetical protein
MNIHISNVSIQCCACNSVQMLTVANFELITTHAEGGNSFRKFLSYDCACSQIIEGTIEVKESAGKPVDYNQQITGGQLRELFGVRIIETPVARLTTFSRNQLYNNR